ncbi:DUF488 domain-containing protein [Thiohalophilus thiocyanatoxydans]|uniref:Uncharacterized protein YeaO (DUF488 family) n=1 Tax=Thiohalophilus thiocyanatoxydans TaxID=381308 RepID=A0A4V3H3I2_9GAMM|nr:DUF488 family protein [Thiohalophilus thiocyanatoxydans]TDX99374.1 uncharacterized protein YeaO (DUF488 family) [Thiohalophilus thiocyanatoxydans]
MPVFLKRAYEAPHPGDGYRVLVDRLWPRGRSKADLQIDEWLKDLAPSDSLRKAFHAGELSWGEFRNAYLGELKLHREKLRRLVQIARGGGLTLVFAAQDERHNNAVVVKQYLKMLGPADLNLPY